MPEGKSMLDPVKPEDSYSAKTHLHQPVPEMATVAATALPADAPEAALPSEVRPEIITWEKLVEAIHASGKAYNMEMIEKAYDLANEAHKGVCRRSGEPYICHPLAVARLVLDLGMASESIAAALLHDVGKPAALEATGCMYTHDALGADIARGILERLRYPSGVIRDVTALIRNHMFDLRTEAKENTIRLWLQEMGIERSRQLIALRRADVHGSGRIEGPVESADRWERILESMIAAGAPFEERQLAVTGADIAGYLGIPPSPRIGYIKAGLLRHCAKRPEDNNKTALLRLSRDLVNNS